MNVILNPLESETLIEKSGVEIPIVFNVGTWEATKCAKAVVECHENNALFVEGSGVLKKTAWFETGRWPAVLRAEDIATTVDLLDR